MASKLYEEIVKITANEKPYIDKWAKLSDDDGEEHTKSNAPRGGRNDEEFAARYLEKLAKSTTLYVGNLCTEPYCTEEHQILELFSFCGEVKNVIMGLNKNTGTPCGFCFVEYYTREDADTAKRCLNLKMLDGKEIRIDFDIGFREGRQYGRGNFDYIINLIFNF